jgi:hypothetical protein
MPPSLPMFTQPFSPPPPSLPPCSDFTRLTPKVKDIVFVATLKIILQPLVEEIPGFGECRYILVTLGGLGCWCIDCTTKATVLLDSL